MMTDQPRPVSPAEISDLLQSMASLDRAASLGERIAWHEHKAAILSRIAATLDTADAHLVAAEAWDQLAALAAEPRLTSGKGERP